MRTLLLATLALLLAPLASADPSGPCVGVNFNGNNLTPGGCPDRGCSTSVNLEINDPGSCIKSGCHGITVLLGSPNSCTGAPGQDGCTGVTVIDPTSGGSCKGGPGKLSDGGQLLPR
jgi:hypothetical protein